jgi:hypothetical protein
MKYTLQLSIDKARDGVWLAFHDPELVKLWQPSLTGVQLLHGTTGEVGAESKLTFTEKEREFSLIERITSCQEPEMLDQVYENEFAVNTVKNSFIDQGENQTLWIAETEYKFKTILMKIMAPLYKKNFAARTKRDMQHFKEMVEKGPGQP